MLHKETTAQVVYVDIDPDTILDERLEAFGLDMDNNGTIDFAFLNSSFSYFYASFSTYRTRQDILAGPYNTLNSLAGISNNFSTGYGSFIWYYPYALVSGELIGNVLEWQNAGEQIMGIRTFVSYAGSNTWQCANCYWYGYFVPETLNKYLGVRFIDDLGQNHYGWIRCDVKDEGRTLVIKDYAYETEPDFPIIAGSTEHYVGINNIQNTVDMSVYSYGKNIYMHVNDLKNIQLIIYDITGKEIIKKELQNENEIINMNNYPSGIYLVTLKQNDNIYSKKVVIE